MTAQTTNDSTPDSILYVLSPEATEAALGIPVYVMDATASLTRLGEAVAVLERLRDQLDTLEPADRAAIQPLLVELVGLDVHP